MKYLSLTKVVAMLSGNSLAIIAKLAVRKAAFPIASTILTRKDNMMNGYLSSTLSRRPKIIALVPTVNIPPLNKSFGPILFS